MKQKILFLNQSLYNQYKDDLNHHELYVNHTENSLQSISQNNIDYLIVDLDNRVETEVLLNIKNINNFSTKKIGVKRNNMLDIKVGGLGLDYIYQKGEKISCLMFDELKKKYPRNLFIEAYVVAELVSIKDDVTLINPYIIKQKKETPVDIYNESFVKQSYNVNKTDFLWELNNPYVNSNIVRFSKEKKPNNTENLINNKVIFYSKSQFVSPHFIDKEVYSCIKKFFDRISEESFDEYYFEHTSPNSIMQKNISWKLIDLLKNKKINFFKSKQSYFNEDNVSFLRKDLQAHFKEMKSENNNSNPVFMIKEQIKINNLSKKEMLIDPQGYELKKGSLLLMRTPFKALLKVKKSKIINDNKIYLCDILDVSDEERIKLNRFFENS